MALHRTRVPGQRHPRFDRSIILREPSREAADGLQRTGRRAPQPRIKRVRLPLADERGKILRQVDRLAHLGLLLP
jgi:hypothetical protein